jgi:hypothetical protein
MNKRDSLWLGVQNVLSHLAAFIYIPLVGVVMRLMGYRFRDLKAFRQQCLEHLRKSSDAG